MLSFTVVDGPSPAWALELIHTKAVRGMIATEARRPFRNNSKSQRYWMLHRPTLDTLWFRPNARVLDLRNARACREHVAAIKADRTVTP